MNGGVAGKEPAERKTPMSAGASASTAISAGGAAASAAAAVQQPVSTSVMMNFMNSMLTTAKSTLQGQGMAVYYDHNGLPVRKF